MLKTGDTKELPATEAREKPEPVVKRRRWVGPSVTAVALLVLALGIYRGITGRVKAEAALATTTRQDAVPAVDVINPQPGAPDQELVLPGVTQAYTNAPIYARTNGYVKRWYFDIGARVKQGDLLAEIETPELDQQLRQARAQLVETQAAFVQSQANMELAKVTNSRSSVLVRQGWTSHQQGDQDRLTYAGSIAAVGVARANLQAQQAQVDRLEQLTGFERVVAPFDGLITARHTDVGHLINSGAGAPSAELFDIAAIDTLRIYVSVPETDAPSIRVGAKAVVTVDEFPGQSFHGTVVRTDHAIDPTSRTLLVEVDVDNAAGRLLPGAYTFVHFTLPAEVNSVIIPANALLFRSEGLTVGVVRNDRAELVPIRIGRDYGDKVQVVSGLSPADQVILNPSDSLVSGTAIRVTNSRKGAPAA
jgi:RND family efflux transporter MFP subunit